MSQDFGENTYSKNSRCSICFVLLVDKLFVLKTCHKTLERILTPKIADTK